MSIQQSLNQALYTSTIAAGLYAHSPAGQKRAEIKQLKKLIPEIESKREAQAEADVDSKVANELYRKNLEAGEKAAARLYELEPTEENYRNIIAEVEGREEYEDILEQSYTKRAQSLQSQKEAFEMRKKLLQGTPEVPVKRKKIDIGGNANV